MGGDTLPLVPALDSETALELALGKTGIPGRRVSDPELTYVLGTDGRGHLAWQTTVEYRNQQGPQRAPATPCATWPTPPNMATPTIGRPATPAPPEAIRGVYGLRRRTEKIGVTVDDEASFEKAVS